MQEGVVRENREHSNTKLKADSWTNILPSDADNIIIDSRLDKQD